MVTETLYVVPVVYSSVLYGKTNVFIVVDNPAHILNVLAHCALEEGPQ